MREVIKEAGGDILCLSCVFAFVHREPLQEAIIQVIAHLNHFAQYTNAIQNTGIVAIYIYNYDFTHSVT